MPRTARPLYSGREVELGEVGVESPRGGPFSPEDEHVWLHFACSQGLT